MAPKTKLDEIRALMAGHTDRDEEARILTIFHEASADELNQLIQGLTRDEFSELARDLDDRMIGPDSRSAFLNLLSKERVGELTLDSKARFIQALQKGITGAVEEKAIGQVLLATTGEALTALKNALDQGGDHRDLQQLVFHDLDSTELRAAVLAHFKKEAPARGDRVKVLSDIDDTFYANLKDDRYPGKTVYPGVREFYAELARGPDLMFLSARPWDRAGAMEQHTRSMLHGYGVTQATVLSGDFAHLIGNNSIAEKKFENWEQLNLLYPEYGSVFIGDSGQGDAIFGAQAAAANADMRAVFIHDVIALDATQRAEFAQKKVFIFDTYVGAATEAFKKGLITSEGLERVMSSASRELNEVPFSSPVQRDARKAELDRDLSLARGILNQH